MGLLNYGHVNYCHVRKLHYITRHSLVRIILNLLGDLNKVLRLALKLSWYVFCSPTDNSVLLYYYASYNKERIYQDISRIFQDISRIF